MDGEVSLCHSKGLGIQRLFFLLIFKMIFLILSTRVFCLLVCEAVRSSGTGTADSCELPHGSLGRASGAFNP